jgi:diadenosine tetraphosphate (Ap4A) HIT family hydrolase
MQIKVLETERSKYRKKNKKTKSCPFCDVKIIRKQGCRSLEGKFWRVFVNKYPYMDGNLMLVTKRHIRNINELSQEEEKEFCKILKIALDKLKNIFKTEDFNISVSIGKNAGASIEHLHWQIIPRHEKLLNATNIFSELFIITMSPEKLRKIIDGRNK